MSPNIGLWIEPKQGLGDLEYNPYPYEDTPEGESPKEKEWENTKDNREERCRNYHF